MYIEEQMQFHKAFSLNPVRNIVKEAKAKLKGP